VTATITGIGENRPMYGGRFCVKPGWGLRLAYHLRKPAEDVNRITGPIGSAYAVTRKTLKALRSWPALPGKWAYSEQAIGMKAYHLDIPIYNEARVLVQHKMKSGTIDVPQEDVLLNAHFVHRAYFDEDTYTDIWRPLLLQRGDSPQIDELLQSPLLRDEAEWFKANRRHTDEDFFRHVLAATPEDLLDFDMKRGAGKPRTQASYIAYESRRAPGREWTADRPRMLRHLGDLMARLNGTALPRACLLDLGSRDGWILDCLIERGFRKGHVHGTELSPWAAKHARSMGRDVDTGDIHNLSRWKPNTFHVVTCIHALEHCHSPAVVLKEIGRVLKPGGMLMLVVPIEPVGLSVAGDHCWAMRSDEAVVHLAETSGLRVETRSRLNDELTLFARK
jgi:SAM-dependent methyltransferase